MADISETELKEEIEKILKDADLAVWTTKKVIQQLEKQYGAGVRKRKAVIDKMVLDYIDSRDDKEDEEDEESEESSEEEKPKRGAAKRAKSEEKESGESLDEEKPKTKRGRRAAPKPRVTKEKTTKAKGTGKKGGGTGFTRSYKLSPALAELMGLDELPRHAVVKRIWAIVKENNLYDPKNRQYAICDDALYKVIGKQRFKVFGMMKYLKGHFLD